jgi:nucleoside-diphosphate kinase
MSLERTLSIIKPDATSRNIIGKIIDRYEENELKVIAGKLIHMNQEKASGFYAEHEGKPFFQNLVEYMTSGPVFVQVLEGENAVLKSRELMGSTDPSEAEPGTIRADFAKTIDANAVHGSDSVESAAREINYFFKTDEIF